MRGKISHGFPWALLAFSMTPVWANLIVLDHTESPLKLSTATAGLSHFMCVNSCPKIMNSAMVMEIMGGERWYFCSC